MEVDLPDGFDFKDKDGQIRTKIRIRLWQRGLPTYRKAALVSEDNLPGVPDVSMPSDNRVEDYRGVPVFFGHYWLTEIPVLFAPNIVCVDYSAVNGGPLVASTSFQICHGALYYLTFKHVILPSLCDGYVPAYTSHRMCGEDLETIRLEGFKGSR